MPSGLSPCEAQDTANIAKTISAGISKYMVVSHSSRQLLFRANVRLSGDRRPRTGVKGLALQD